MSEMPKDHDSLAERAFSGAAWITVGMAVPQAMSLVIFGVIAHFVTPSDFGLISISFLVLQTSKSILVDGFANSLMRIPSPSNAEYSTAFWLTLIFSVGVFLMIQMLSHVVQQILHFPGLGLIMREMSAIIIVMGLGHTHECWMIRNFRFRALTFRNVVGSAVGGGTGIALACAGHGVTAIVVQQVITYTVSLTLLWINCPWRPKIAISKPAASGIFRFMMQTLPGGLVSMLNQNCDTMLVAFFFGPASTGIYSAAKRIRLALQLAIVTPFSGVVMPILAEVQTDATKLRKVLLAVIMSVCVFCAPVFLGMSAIASDVVIVTFGTKWAAVAPVLAWLSTGGFVSVLLSYNDVVFTVRGRPIWSFYVATVYTGLAIVAFAVCARFGNDYIAVPFVAPLAITLPLSVRLLTRLANVTVRDWIIATSPAVGAACVMFFGIRWLANQIEGDEITRLLLLCPAGAILYFTTMFIVGRHSMTAVAELVRKGVKRAPARTTQT